MEKLIAHKAIKNLTFVQFKKILCEGQQIFSYVPRGIK
jgi:hypothetical protein